ncbi:MAG: hypothetical protein AB1798_13420, partial [Spirochaetota bacterium]
EFALFKKQSEIEARLRPNNFLDRMVDGINEFSSKAGFNGRIDYREIKSIFTTVDKIFKEIFHGKFNGKD